MSNNIDILINLKDQATAGIKKLNGQIGDMKSELNTMGIASAAAFTGLAFFAKWAVEAAMGQERANAQLEATLKSTGNAVGLTSKQIQGYAGELQTTLGIEDDVIQSGQNMLLTFTNIGKDVFPEATKTLVDMATAMNGGAKPSSEALSAQAIQLGKALNDPIKGISALSRVGVTFTEEQKNTIKTLQEAGDTMGAQKVILAELAKEFGGSALAQTKTFEGQMGLLNVQVKDAYEGIGTALIPVIMDLAKTVIPYIKIMTEWIAANPELTKTILLVGLAVTGLGASVLILGPIVTGVTAIFGFLSAAAGVLGTALAFLAANPIVLIIAAIAALGVALFYVWKNWDEIKPKLLEFWEGIKTSFTATVGAITSYITDAFTKTVAYITDKIAWLKTKAQEAKDFVSSILAQTAKVGSNFTIQGALGLNADFSKKLDGARATGGPVMGGGSYLVGENGPEIFTPRTGGNITPNSAIGGNTINVNLGGVSVRNDRDIQAITDSVLDALTRKTQLWKLWIA